MVIACLENIWGRDKVVFTVPLPKCEPVYMSMEISNYGKDNFGILAVDSNKFLHLWRSTLYKNHQGVANGSPETWPQDYKYKYAIEGFSAGRKSPVPLANVTYEKQTVITISPRFLGFGQRQVRKEVESISITDGVTRTIWLLTQGCPVFPVQCNVSSAPFLVQAAAPKGAVFYTLGELVRRLQEQTSVAL